MNRFVKRSMRRSLFTWLFVGVWMFAIVGCGTGFSSYDAVKNIPTQTAPTTGQGRVLLTVKWPTATRLIPQAANSIRASLTLGATQLGSQLLTRPSSGNTSTATFTNVMIGNLTLTATAFPNADGSGTAQAQGSTPVTVTGGATATVSVTMTSTIDHLAAAPNPVSVQITKTTPVTVSALDKSGAVVLTSAFQWKSSDTTTVSVDASGNVTGVQVGSAQITVTETESGQSLTLPVSVLPAPNPFLYDGFAYTVGANLQNQNGGTGSWGDAWNEYGQGNTSSVIASGSLTFGNLATTGNCVQTTSDYPVGHARRFKTSPGKTGSVLFISYLVKPTDALNVGYPSSYFGLAYGGVGMGMGGSGKYYGLENDGGGSRVDSTVPIQTNVTAFLVERITFGAANANDTINLYVNPTPGQPLPATPDCTKTDRNTGVPADFNIGSSIRCQFDEIRFGRTFEDVSPTN